MRNFWLPSHLHNSSQVIEVEKGRAAKHRTDKSASFTCTALNIFALEVISPTPPQKSWRWRREVGGVERAGACRLSPLRWNRVCRVFVRSALAPALLPAACQLFWGNGEQPLAGGRVSQNPFSSLPRSPPQCDVSLSKAAGFFGKKAKEEGEQWGVFNLCCIKALPGSGGNGFNLQSY